MHIFNFVVFGLIYNYNDKKKFSHIKQQEKYKRKKKF